MGREAKLLKIKQRLSGLLTDSASAVQSTEIFNRSARSIAVKKSFTDLLDSFYPFSNSEIEILN